jgi:hypothetical protein
MADIRLLPSASPVPIVQTVRRGALPKAITRIGRSVGHRCRGAASVDTLPPALADEYRARMLELLRASSMGVAGLDGTISGLIVTFQRRDGTYSSAFAGSLREDVNAAARAAESLLAMVKKSSG